ncbi:hypothetical protein GCG54_00001498 [Colletotrichum gloeosporioides]|uniref:Uncharacterized protein n=1 Tax=Colletotrichum gloeosporioides TaxID=474922 RepID=A0A8H4CWE5_COLGL|nr:uncharacterized protein GCG54_00001498 [Colletotrichum gloeosporioides]KAF3811184.1 hypothetical protein GCG54_00001498 [Colletotrichum gloeosporioides]
MSSSTVGSLLAAIATLISDGLRILKFADKHHWGPDEHEQLRLLEDTLDDAKKDFQELSVLVNGQRYYMNDRRRELTNPELALLPCLVAPRTAFPARFYGTPRLIRSVIADVAAAAAAAAATRPSTDAIFLAQSISELKRLQGKFETHIENFKDWAKVGGPINPIWARETTELRRELHRAQCRAARRIFNSEQESSSRCLGAFLVYRKQREWATRTIVTEEEFHRRHVEEVRACNNIGKFERFGDRDIAFVCDFCDGHLVWGDLETMPAVRAATDATINAVRPGSPTQLPHWQATAYGAANREQKTVVYAPLAIANHIAPYQGDWVARLECPFCDEAPYIEPGEDGDDEMRNAQDESGFEDLQAFQEHLEWQHTATSIPAVPLPKAAKDCVVM